MPSWYIGKIRYQQPIDEMAIGTRNESLIKQKTVSESYLIDAISYTDAEARLYGVVADNTPDFQITGLRPMQLSDVFHLETGEKWYKCKVVYTTEDERSGKEKKVVNVMLINAETVKEAYDRIQDSLKTMLMPFDITDINLTPILEVVPYEESQDGVPANLRPLSEVSA
ncbi:MAG: DUF4494 domain-containing protein [Bacteroidetes bacterium]|nr:DUF4494 domain-containing protein [Fibrella sp.]